MFNILNDWETKVSYILLYICSVFYHSHKNSYIFIKFNFFGPNKRWFIVSILNMEIKHHIMLKFWNEIKLKKLNNFWKTYLCVKPVQDFKQNVSRAWHGALD